MAPICSQDDACTQLSHSPGWASEEPSRLAHYPMKPDPRYGETRRKGAGDAEPRAGAAGAPGALGTNPPGCGPPPPPRRRRSVPAQISTQSLSRQASPEAKSNGLVYSSCRSKPTPSANPDAPFPPNYLRN